MNCKDYIFLQTSGKIHTFGFVQRAWVMKHLLICTTCHNFTQNNQKLTQILRHYNRRLTDDDGS